jgi:hypothetical protein
MPIETKCLPDEQTDTNSLALQLAVFERLDQVDDSCQEPLLRLKRIQSSLLPLRIRSSTKVCCEDG